MLLRHIVQTHLRAVDPNTVQQVRGWRSARDFLASSLSVAQVEWIHLRDENPHHGVHGDDDHFVLWRREDLTNWIVFFVAFVVLLGFDNFVLHRRHRVLSFTTAVLYSSFWFLCAVGFCAFVYFSRGPADALNWGTGYLLEWLLSVDNLFVFRSIFLIFKTPDDQKHKPLFWGIVGAIIFRMGFFALEQYLVNKVTWMHIVLGLFLIYTGIKVLVVDEEVNPEDSMLYRRIIRLVPFVDGYSPEGRFFAWVPVNKDGEAILPDWDPPIMPTGRGPAAQQNLRRRSTEDAGSAVPADNPSGNPSGQDGVITTPSMVEVGRQFKATRLFLVVLCLEVTDILFAVDSVSAIVAQIPDLFLAYTACVFAMLGLRATFFVVDELVKLFSLLSYAVAIILIFLGCKLLAHTWVDIAPEVVCAVLISVLAISLVASLILEGCRRQDKGSDEEACDKDAAKVEPAALEGCREGVRKVNEEAEPDKVETRN